MDWPQIGPKIALKQGKERQKDKWHLFRAPTPPPSPTCVSQRVLQGGPKESFKAICGIIDLARLKNHLPQLRGIARYCDTITPDFSQAEIGSAATNFYDSGGSLGEEFGRNFLRIFVLHLLCRMTHKSSPNLSLLVLWLQI